MNKSILLDALGGLFHGMVHSERNFNSKAISFKDLESKFFQKPPIHLNQYENNHYCNKDIVINVKDLENKNYTVNCCLNCQIGNIKLELINYGIPRPEHWKLMNFNSPEILNDDYSLKFCNINHNSNLRLIGNIDLAGGGPKEFYLPDDICDPKYDYDFRHINDHNKTFYKGGYEYKRPCGWIKYGLNVKGKYENDEWLGGKNEWAVSYHGTNVKNIESIIKNGFKVGPRHLYGYGIYSTPNIKVAESYSSIFTNPKSGKRYKIVMQNRVKPSEIINCSTINNGPKDYWLVPDGKYIRPYAICVKEF